MLSPSQTHPARYTEKSLLMEEDAEEMRNGEEELKQELSLSV